jgi:hypothetical protein
VGEARVIGALLIALGGLAPTDADWATFAAEADHQARYEAFVAFLDREGVGDVVTPPWHLWRQGTDWQDAKQPPFAVPSKDQWGAMTPALKLLRDEIIPLVGPVEVVSGFRTDAYNRLAGGAKSSRHKWFEAVDVVPKRELSREQLHGLLLPWWKERGPALRVGLGLYAGVRFHVDTHRHRRW